MPKIAIEQPHGLTAEQARASAERLCGLLAKRYGIASQWTGETEARLLGKGVAGHARIEAQRVLVALDLSFALAPMKSRIEVTIREQLKILLEEG